MIAARASAYKRSQAEAPAEVEPVESGPAEVEEPLAGDVLDLEAPPSGPAADVERDLDDLLPPLSDTGSGVGGLEAQTDDDSVEEAESVETPEEAGQETLDVRGGPGDLGTLPDISNLGIGSRRPGGASTGNPRGAGAGMSGRSSGGAQLPPTPGDEMKGSLGSQDPSTLARAIRTVLKRDEKG